MMMDSTLHVLIDPDDSIAIQTIKRSIRREEQQDRRRFCWIEVEVSSISISLALGGNARTNSESKNFRRQN